MSTPRPNRRDVVIFSDEPGWHGRSLRRALGRHGLSARFVSLGVCSIDLSGAAPVVVIPGFDERPTGAFVRGIAGGTLEEVISRLNVLHGLELLGVPVFNSGRAIERTVDKAMTSFLLAARRIPSPRTWVTETRSAARTIVQDELHAGRTLVLKPLFGSQGNGIVRIDSLDTFEREMPAGGVYYLQEYLDAGETEFRDWRVFVIDGHAVAVMQRRSQHWVTNRAQGAVCEAVQADPVQRALAEAAADAVGVDYAGVDILRDARGNWCVGEVNGIPAWQGLQRASGVHLSRCLADAFAARIDRTLGFAATA